MTVYKNAIWTFMKLLLSSVIVLGFIKDQSY